MKWSTTKQFYAYLKRRAKAKEKMFPYACDSGPFEGESIYLTPSDTSTMVFTVNGMTGRYYGNSSGWYRTIRTAHWKEAKVQP